MSNGVRIDPAALLVFAAAWYFTGSEVMATILLPIAVHELGHISAMNILGGGVCGFSAEKSGFAIAYYGLNDVSEPVTAAAGPLAGILFAGAVWNVGGDFFKRSADISLMLSAYNLMPVYPLDGKYIFSALFKPSGKTERRVSAAVKLGLIIAGIVSAHAGHGLGIFLGAVMLLLQREDTPEQCIY